MWAIRTFGQNRICYSLEVSYALKGNYQFGKDETKYPIHSLEVKNSGKLSYFNLNLLKLFDI